jgi:hypothetical protein
MASNELHISCRKGKGLVFWLGKVCVGFQKHFFCILVSWVLLHLHLHSVELMMGEFRTEDLVHNVLCWVMYEL